MNKMEMKIVAIFVAIVVLVALVLFVSGAGCGQATAENDAKALDSDLNDLEQTSNEIGDMNMDELSESELTEIEDLL